jgi:hypothetical protein
VYEIVSWQEVVIYSTYLALPVFIATKFLLSFDILCTVMLKQAVKKGFEWCKHPTTLWTNLFGVITK